MTLIILINIKELYNEIIYGIEYIVSKKYIVIIYIIVSHGLHIGMNFII